MIEIAWEIIFTYTIYYFLYANIGMKLKNGIWASNI